MEKKGLIYCLAFISFNLYIYPSELPKSVVYIVQAIAPTCFQKCQDIVAPLKFFILLF